jgi:hypothetical protein
LGKLRRALVGLTLPNFRSKRGKKAKPPDSQDLLSRGPPGGEQMDRWVPADIIKSELKTVLVVL